MGVRFLPDRSPFFGPVSAWTPASLGASLVAWWDAERSDLITQAAGAVSSWKDIVAAIDVVQATGANQPAYSATSFGGRPGVTFNGTSHLLSRPGAHPASIPSGANPSEIWVLTDQVALPADTTSRVAVGYGNSAITMRRVDRIVSASVNRTRISTGTGAASPIADNLTVVLSGRHVIRGQFGAASSQADVDGIAGTTVAAVPGTSTAGLMFGASPNNSTLFWSGTHSAVLITLPLNAEQATQMYAYLNSRIAVFDPDVVTWSTAVNANGGTVSSGRAALLSTMVAAWKAAGTWSLIDDAWLLVAENEPQALTSLKQRRLATAVAAPTFTVDRGYAFNGTTQYINTGFVPSTHAGAALGNNVRVAVYARADTFSSSAVSIGSGNSTTAIIQLTTHTGSSTMLARLNMNGTVAYSLSPVTSLGYSAISRNGDDPVTSGKGYKNGVPRTQTGVGGPVGTVLAPTALYIGAYNSSGTAANFAAATLGLACFGAALSDAQELAEYNAIQAYMTAVGANV